MTTEELNQLLDTYSDSDSLLSFSGSLMIIIVITSIFLTLLIVAYSVFSMISRYRTNKAILETRDEIRKIRTLLEEKSIQKNQDTSLKPKIDNNFKG